jgi:hypothetical protein
MCLRAVTCGAKVCHFHDPGLIPIGFVLKLPGRRVIYEVHEDCPRGILTKSWVHRTIKDPLAAAVSLVEAVTGHVFDGIVTATPTIAARFPAAKTNTLANFPMLDEFRAVVQTAYDEDPSGSAMSDTPLEGAGPVRYDRRSGAGTRR